MRVLINATSARIGGGVTVLRNLLPALCAQDGGANEYRVIAREEVSAQLDPRHPRVHVEAPAMVGSSILSRAAWEQLHLPALALRKTDLLFSPAGLATFVSPVPQVLMVQNMAPFDPDVLSRCTPGVRRRMRILRELGILSARRSCRVVFISDFARTQLTPLFEIPTSRTARLHLGRDHAFSPQAIDRAPAMLDRLGISRPYLLSVGQFYPYKNIVELVVGFARARASLPKEMMLVLAGAEVEASVSHAVRTAIAREGLQEHVKLVGQIRYDDLPPLYAAASLFIFPSSCENFPNILVEGLASGVPVLCSSLGPMREIAGAGADYFDPFDPDAIASAIVRLHHDPARQSELRARGTEAAGRYSWDVTAAGLLEVFSSAIQ
jgi:glycosyltransferase involved in cell wall biosynthesis